MQVQDEHVQGKIIGKYIATYHEYTSTYNILYNTIRISQGGDPTVSQIHPYSAERDRTLLVRMLNMLNLKCEI